MFLTGEGAKGQRVQASGIATQHAIAAALNDRGIPTAGGSGRWQATTVGRRWLRPALSGAMKASMMDAG